MPTAAPKKYSCAYITDKQDFFLKPDGAFVYCIGERKAWRDDMMGIHTADKRAQAAFIAKDMFARRIKQIICDDTLPELLEGIKGLHEIDGRFNLAGGIKVLENIWGTIGGKGVGKVNDIERAYVGKPCIIVAGGPSAALSYERLSEIKDKIIIIAVGSGIIGLSAAGIVPHYVLSIDPFEEMADEILPVARPETTLIADIQTNTRLVQNFPGKVLVYASDYDKRCVPELSKVVDIPTNTTASTSAFQFALYCGFDPIVLCGMDFCYNQDRKHVSDILSANSKPFDRVLIDQDGVERQTNAAYLDTYTFMNMVIPVSGRKVYNVRETGAGLAGTIPIQLKDFELAEKIWQENTISSLNVTVDKIAILRSIELMLVKVRGRRKKFKAATFDDWFSRLRLEPAYKYLSQHLDWVWFELDDKAAVLNRAEYALVTLRSLLLGEASKDA